MINAVKLWCRGVISRYIFNRDVQENEKRIIAKLVEGKQREAAAMRKVYEARGGESVRKRASDAEREAELLRREAVRLGVRVVGRR